MKMVEQRLSGSNSILQIDDDLIRFSSTSGNSLDISAISLDGNLQFLSSNDTFFSGGGEYQVVLGSSGTGTYVTSVFLGGAGFTEGTLAGGVVGLETSPANMPTSGSASYNGSFFASGLVEENGTLADGFVMQSGVTIGANFTSGTVNGTFNNGTVTYVDENSVSSSDVFSGSFSNAAITGNGYQGDLVFGCNSNFTCTDSSEIGGVFYGPSAQETGGLAIIDFTRRNGFTNDLFEFEGVGTFVAN